MITQEEIDSKTKIRKIHEQKITGIKDVINSRRLEVLKQKIQSFTNHEIAKNLNIGLSTVEKDVSRIKDFSFKLFNDLKEAGVITEIAKSYAPIEAIEEKLWEICKKNEVKKIKEMKDETEYELIKKEMKDDPGMKKYIEGLIYVYGSNKNNWNYGEYNEMNSRFGDDLRSWPKDR